MTNPELIPVDVAIIGAGFAGLSAAHALRAGGAKALLLEAQDAPGGRVKTVQHADGRAYDKGGQFYCRDMTRICATAGLAQNRAWPRATAPRRLFRKLHEQRT